MAGPPGTGGLIHERYPSLDRIARVPCPLLILHGRRDRLIPFQLGMELYQAARLSRWVGARVSVFCVCD